MYNIFSIHQAIYNCIIILIKKDCVYLAPDSFIFVAGKEGIIACIEKKR